MKYLLVLTLFSQVDSSIVSQQTHIVNGKEECHATGAAYRYSPLFEDMKNPWRFAECRPIVRLK